MAKRSSQGIRNLQSAGRTSDKAATGLARWATTDHVDMGRTLGIISATEFANTVRHILMHLLIAVAGAVLSVAWIMVLIGYGIPLLITGHF
jgi:hypothetical protein